MVAMWISLTCMFNNRIACCLTGTEAAQWHAELSSCCGLSRMDDGYWKGCEARVKWSGSDQVLLRTTKQERSTLQWNDLDGGHLLLIDLQPLQRGPPGQAWSVALSNPMQHLCIPELWMEAFCPTIETNNLAPMAFCCLDTTNHRAACSWYPKETGPELRGINQFTTSWMMSVSVPVMINGISSSTIGN